jgi:hypothetical protein
VTIAAVDIEPVLRSMGRLEELQEQRRHECRLTPDRALASLDEAEAFVRDRGLLTRTPGSALPSLFGAFHDDPYAAGKGGFAEWPATKWRWPGALLAREGVHALKIHRGKTLFVTDDIVELVDPICRAEIARMEAADPDWARLLRHLADAGPSEPEDLRTELGLKARELKSLRYPLERCGAIVSRGVTHDVPGGGHVHTSVLARWDQVFPERPQGGGLDNLVVAGVRAAVVAPERELRRWFSWPWLFDDDLVDRLVAPGRLERVDGWVTAP